MEKNLLETRLKDVLHDVTDWLKFAEAKNVLVITFNSAWLTIYIKNIFESNVNNKNLYIILSGICIVTLIITFISFIPKMFKPKFIDRVIDRKIGEKKNEDNLLFYRDILKYSVDDYFSSVNNRFFDEELDDKESNYNYEKEIIRQIMIISHITYEKYYIFNISIVLSVIPSLILFILFVYNMIAPITINLPKIF